MKRFFYVQTKAWLPAVIWCALIFWGSTDDVGGKATSLRVMTFLHENFPTLSWEQLAKTIFYLRKACHVTEYGILAALVFFGFLHSGLVGLRRFWSSRMAILTFLICVGYAVSDEIHQSFSVERHGTYEDVMIDAFGVLLGLTGMWVWSYFKRGTLRKKPKAAAELLYSQAFQSPSAGGFKAGS
ncbi:MAG: VanZ family protein [Limisphaerales bacterium]|jgi:VanZ family protein|nr:VanZ family protein [Verrucomicrobiota bacterium]